MSGDSIPSVADAATAKEDGGGRQRSTIAFPYSDLASAIQMAEAIHSNVGSGECSDDQLAPWTNQSPKSSAYRTQVASARHFRLIEGGSGSGMHRLSDLGRRAMDPSQARAALVDAFLSVPLYREVYDKYSGGVVPPAAALERDMQGLGVADKQKSRARQVLERSAERAGFFEHGRNRLVRPGVTTPQNDPPVNEVDENPNHGGGDGSDGLHPFIQGLLGSLPEPDSEWPIPERAKWLQTAANIFDLMYEGEGGIDVRAAIAERSPRPE